MTQWRHHIAICLIAVLTLTGHSMAVARGMSGHVGMMELCTGTNIVMVPMDANGDPSGPAHICPEFSLMLSEAIAPSVSFSPPEHLRFSPAAWPEKTQTTAHVTIAAVARAPPASF